MSNRAAAGVSPAHERAGVIVGAGVGWIARVICSDDLAPGRHPGDGQADPAHRRAAIEELYTEDCTVLLPIGRYVGHQALDQVASELRAGHPSFVYTPHSTPQAVQDGGRIAWGSGPAGKPPRYTGLDVIIVRDGKIAALYVFLDSLPV